MKIDLHKIADTVIRVGGPLVLAALTHKLATGKLDAKATVADALERAVLNGAVALPGGAGGAAELTIAAAAAALRR